MTLKDLTLDNSWSLFLDRDGVINERIVDDYVKNPAQFRFLDGVVDSIALLNKVFGKVFVVTNQQGIGKGLMTVKDLEDVHDFMTKSIEDKGGKINNIYFCPHLEAEECDCRKPNTGMALQAQMDHPEISFGKSILVGDSKSDIQLGKNLGMITVLIGDRYGTAAINKMRPDFHFFDIETFTKQLIEE